VWLQVLQGLQLIKTLGSVERFDDVGIVAVRALEPVHYTSLFSFSVGADVVVSMYSGNRYEVECKYTQFVDVHSRPVHARLDKTPLCKVGLWRNRIYTEGCASLLGHCIERSALNVVLYFLRGCSCRRVNSRYEVECKVHTVCRCA
jgi:hypothetical protein